MSRPEQVQIGPYVFRVEEDQRLSDANRCYGRIDWKPLIIMLAPGLDHEYERAVMLHEVLHGIWDLAHADGFLKTEDPEEPIIRALAPLLLDTLRRNPELAAYLMEAPQ